MTTSPRSVSAHPSSAHPSSTLFVNGTVLDKAGRRQADVLVDAVSGQIEAVGSNLTSNAAVTNRSAGAEVVVVDIEGCLLTPGLVDLASHLREPGGEAAETIRSGSRAAACGGYTAVLAMPDTHPCLDSASVLAMVRAAASDALCEVVPAGAISVGRLGHELAPIGELAGLGVRVFTDNGRGIQDPQFLRRAFEYADSIGSSLVLMQGGVIAELAAGSVMHEGPMSVKLGLAGQPGLAETLFVERDIALARLTGGRLHLQVSTAGSVEAVRRAKSEGLRVTASVAPHHFSLTDAACERYDPLVRIEPPLRSSADVEAIRLGLSDGSIDAIATAHQPHPPDAKERPFDQASPGAIGLETALAVALADSELSLDALLPLMSWQPASIAGLDERHGCPIEVGQPANLAIIDPAHEWMVDAAAFASKATNSPFIGRQLKGKVRHTVYRGQLVVIDTKASR